MFSSLCRSPTAGTIFSGLKLPLRTLATEVNNKYRVVFVGGGAGGLAVSNALAPVLKGEKLALVEPSDKHFNQPLWTFVGGGVKQFEESVRPMSDFIPKEVDWIKDKAIQIDPLKKTVHLGRGQTLSYDYLVLAPGIQVNWDAIKGLPETLGKNGVTSNYDSESVQRTWEFINSTKKGNAIFTMPSTPIKCAGAPQKIMYLAEEQFSSLGVRDNVNVSFYSGAGAIFAVQKYANSLTKVCNSREIKANFFHNLVEIDSLNRIAIFQTNKPDSEAATVNVPYDFIHVTPPMGPPSWIKKSGMADAAGWVDVNKETLQHNKYSEIFALGDASSVPTSKTAAAVAVQSGVLEQNLLAVMSGSNPTAKYNGYTSCPLVTGRGKLILAEFSGFNGQPLETFPVDQGEERASMYYLTSEVIPLLYWHALLRGSWKGPSKIREALQPARSL